MVWEHMEPSEKEKSLTQKCQTGWDMWSFPEGYSWWSYMHTDDKHEGMNIYKHDGFGSLLFTRAI